MYDEVKVMHYLSHISYYHLSAYFKSFQSFESETFQKGTTFEDVMELYFFDRKLRLLFLDAIERIETSFKCQFACHLSLCHGSDCLTTNDIFKKHKEKIDENLKRTKEQFIDNFKAKYDNDYPPIWILVEILAFGDVLNVYRYSTPFQEQKSIADMYGKGWKYIYSWLENLREVRNISAHHSRLWNRKITKHIKKDSKNTAFQYNYQIWDSVVAVYILLRHVSPDYEWKEKVENLIESYKIDIEDMGFPDDWLDRLREITNT
jgi:abortive infection bacteriophage resistance protein